MVEFNNNVEQLIKETDEAFQAVGFALGDAKIATRGWQQYDNRQNRLSNGKPITITIARTNSISKRDLMKTSQEIPSSSGLSGKSPVPKSIVASKTKKTNSPKQKKHNSALKSSRKSLPHPHSSARWNLGDVTASMADVFTGKMFAKIEVDEMLTPDRIQQLEEKAKKLEDERKASIESSQTEATRDSEGTSPIDQSHRLDGSQIFEAETVSPTEPFHLENLLSQINKSDPSLAPNPAEPIPPTVGTPETSEKDEQSSRKPLPDLPASDDPDFDAIEQAFEDLHFPSPPRDSVSRAPRSRSNTGVTNLLPTIPEISSIHITTPRTAKRSISQDSEYSQESQSSSVNDYVQLPSTPFTLTSPLFRHGMIRLEHVQHHTRRDSVTSPDEALDWTAFQMAISGTMDDGGLGVDEETIWEADEAEVDGILEWWTGFGYQGFGRLVTESTASRRKRGKSDAGKESRQSKNPIRDSIAHTGLGIKAPGTDYIGGPWADQFQDQPVYANNYSYPSQLKPRPTQTQIQRPENPLTPSPGQGARRDVVLKMDVTTQASSSTDEDEDDSPPPSPINLVKIKDEYIPMGYNLGHDLGDFLNWETYHVQSLFGEDEARGYM